jgi:hypothetical protein
MANLYAHVLNGTLIDPISSTDIGAHLQVTVAAGPDASFMDETRRPELPARNFKVTGTVVKHRSTGRRFIAVWQNTFRDDDSVFAMGFVVDKAIELFLAGP